MPCDGYQLYFPLQIPELSNYFRLGWLSTYDNFFLSSKYHIMFNVHQKITCELENHSYHETFDSKAIANLTFIVVGFIETISTSKQLILFK